MDIELLTIGKTGSTYLQTGIDDYCKRLKRYIPFSIKTLPDAKNTRKLTEAQQKEAEGRDILAAVGPADLVILLDERGKEYTSVEFSDFINRAMVSGRKRLVFVVGGPYGFSPAVYDRADGKVSLSRMTFSHEMVRLFFTEQIFRAMTILRGEPYHHE
ncbi:MAG: 23S rRNA (pseudouridine(1915)-N(3))-methyltransferase RlmH [Bacteroides sp.]|nr:23S rRNA (pseudouridine(1915)-N(3))-methyltransferase RlmH [Bacteroidales bacterium]MBD5336967.1 23S rRNA (pseudouridine(1915)-N(3))-methyltransferase RlmH [Bacteroides sp.]